MEGVMVDTRVDVLSVLLYVALLFSPTMPPRFSHTSIGQFGALSLVRESLARVLTRTIILVSRTV